MGFSRMLSKNECNLSARGISLTTNTPRPDAQGLRDILTGLFVLGLAVALLALLPSQVGGAGLDAIGNLRSPAFFPVLAGALMAAFSAALILRGGIAVVSRRRISAPPKPDSTDVNASGDWRRVLSVGTLMVLAAFAIPRIGFVATAAPLMAGVALAFGYRRFGILVAICVIVPLGIFFTFETALRVLLPRGMF